jgi:hypothetical protein
LRAERGADELASAQHFARRIEPLGEAPIELKLTHGSTNCPRFG